MTRITVFLVALAGTLNAANAADEITAVGRSNSSGVYEFFRVSVLGKQGRFREDTVSQRSAKDVLEAVAKSPSAIGYGSMPDAKANVKVLKVAVTDGKPIPLNEKAVRNGDYPLARPLFLYSPKPAGATAHFLAWIRSSEGQEIAKTNGYLPIADPPKPPADKPPDAEIRIGGSDSMINIEQQWAEAYAKKYSNVKIQVSGGGTGVGIARLIDGSIELASSVRAMTPQEKKQASDALGEVEEHTIVYDALAVFVHKDNPLESISLAELAEIYGGGTIDKWSDLSAKRKEEREK